ncbi:heat shock protein 70 precursor, partial [Reticulomyxa filosa]
DLGTTYSCVGVTLNGKVKIIPNEMGERKTPSYVAFTEKELLIGELAKNQAIIDPKNTIFDNNCVKKKQKIIKVNFFFFDDLNNTQNLYSLIGRRFNDKTVQEDMKLWPFEVINKNDRPHVKVTYKGEKRTFAAEEIFAMMLQKMKDIAENYLGKSITHAITTVPAYFDNSQREAVREAGESINLKLLHIINEPTAATVAYGFYKNYNEANIIIYNLGGSTFDVSLIKLEEGIYEIEAMNGDTHLGGRDFDERVMTYFINQFKHKHNIDLRQNSYAIAKLRRECEKAKHTLSTVTQVKVEIENLVDGIDLSETLTRTMFEELNYDLFKKTITLLDTLLKNSQFNNSDIHEVKFYYYFEICI